MSCIDILGILGQVLWEKPQPNTLQQLALLWSLIETEMEIVWPVTPNALIIMSQIISVPVCFPIDIVMNADKNLENSDHGILNSWEQTSKSFADFQKGFVQVLAYICSEKGFLTVGINYGFVIFYGFSCRDRHKSADLRGALDF